MTHNERAKRSRSCRTGKKAYRDQEDAKRAIRNVKSGVARGRIGDTGRIPVRAYECEFCPGWHLTGQEFGSRD